MGGEVTGVAWHACGRRAGKLELGRVGADANVEEKR